MELEQITEVGSDCTCGYIIKFERPYTLREVIGEILSRTGEWGTICFKVDSKCYKIDYKNGKICSDIASFEHLLDSRVTYGRANGGWSRMDYDVRTSKEESMEENFAECIEKTIQECLFGKEETMEEINIDRISFNGDKAKLILPNGYEFKIEDNEVYVVKKKPQYPKTYEECCRALNVWYKDDVAYVAGYQNTLLRSL